MRGSSSVANFVSGSFRDPDTRVFRHDGKNCQCLSVRAKGASLLQLNLTIVVLQEGMTLPVPESYTTHGLPIVTAEVWRDG